MPEVADIVRRYGREYLDQFGAALLPSHRRALEDRLSCRTEALGGHLFQCDHCGHEHFAYHSCRNRSCPKCHGHDTQPQELREIVRRNQKDLHNILLRAAAPALTKLAADPHDVGGLIGVLCMLQTWTRTLAYHLYVHGLVPAGGVSADRTQWRPARCSYLVPVRALSQLLRGLCRHLVRQERPDLAIPESVWTTEWVVYGKGTVQGSEPVLNDLGRYVYRMALTNIHMLSIDDGQVSFRSQDARDSRWKTMTLPALEFIRRFLQHVWPQGFHNVRYDGLWSPVHRPLLHQLQLWLAWHAPDPPPASPEPLPRPDDSCGPPRRAGLPWPHGGHGLLILMRTLPRRQRKPP